tara:strand:- start:26042 stop:27199 length:1158 start_codon:yes stop_codon:yes gene_type:complete
MYRFDKLKSLSKKITWFLLKGEKPSDLETSEMFDENEKKQLLFDSIEESQKDEFAQFTSKLNKQEAWKNIIASEKQRRTIKIRPWLYAAIAVVVLLSVAIFFNNDNELLKNKQHVISDNNIETGTDKATLLLEDGTKIALEKGTTYQTPNANSNGEEIIYKATGKNISYNTLAIPRGGQFQIQLSDGTKVWLNSESKIKYPVAFIEGETRQVELIYGEAYFDVSPSTEHKGATFKVFNQSQIVEVLGTQFNVKAYKEDTNVYTTLVEGKVAINYADKNKILAPNQQAVLNTQSNTIETSMVDVHNETSWVKGLFSFKRKPLIEIMQVLARWYDIDAVNFETKALETVYFDGVLSKNQNIKDILNIIKDTGFITNFTITGKKITIH